MQTLAALESDLTFDQLYVEYASQPIGLDQPRPRFSWALTATGRNRSQAAYQVQVASSVERLLAGRPDLWDSGQVTSGQSLQVPYGGGALVSRQRCFWRVRVWDEAGRATPYSVMRSWEMGLLQPEDWTAEWIGYEGGWPGRALYFRRAFVAPRPVEQARVYVAGIGYHEVRINGAKVGENVLDPGWTDYTQRVLYVTHDVTSLLRPGENVIGAVVGQGWYGAPRLRLQLEITYADGSRETIATRGGHTEAPDTWFVTAGPILANSVYDGEVYDARREKPGWDEPGNRLPEGNAREDGWSTAMPVSAPGGRMVSQKLEPIRVMGTRTPVAMSEPRPGVYVFDAGQNLAGWAAIRVAGPAGASIRLRFAETLRADGTVNQDNLRRAAASDTYILRGGGPENWEPRFTYHGFRYVEVEGWPGRPGPGDLMIREVRSAVEPTGSFSSSNAMLDRISALVAATEASNLHSVPTDCPQRDERMGWLNDMTVRIEPALYTFRLARFYDKFIDDVADTQDAEGRITDTAPFKWGKRPADPVSASYLLLAWQCYLHFGDTELMRRHFDGFRRWVDYLASRTKDGSLDYSSWGDWAPPRSVAVAESEGSGAISAGTPGELISTGFLAYQARLLAQMATVLGEKAAAARYDDLAATTLAAFNRHYWNDRTGGYGSNNQACNAFALFLGAVPAGHESSVVENLAQAVRAADDHVTTGNLCTKYLLEMLSEHGHGDVALRLATQRTYPSWGFMVDHGATTLWERWEYLTGGAMNSHNHAMLGSVGSWFYKYLGGIAPDPAGPGFSRFVLAPQAVGDLDRVEARYRPLPGEIRSAWRREADGLHYTFAIPVNTRAIVRLAAPGVGGVRESGSPLTQVAGVVIRQANGPQIEFELGSGDYEVTVPAR